MPPGISRVSAAAYQPHMALTPADFIFQLNDNEFQDLKSQYTISSKGGIRKLPYAFTEQGIYKRILYCHISIFGTNK